MRAAPDPETVPRSCRARLDPERRRGPPVRDLYRLAWSLCGSRQLAEELTQETYARVLSRPRRLSGGSDFHYLARTLRNVMTDHWRAERRRPATSDDVLVDAPDARAPIRTSPRSPARCTPRWPRCPSTCATWRRRSTSPA